MKKRIEEQIRNEERELIEEVLGGKYNQNYEKLISDLTVLKYLMGDCLKPNIRKLTTAFLCEKEKEHFKSILKDLDCLHLYIFLEVIKEILIHLIDGDMSVSDSYFLLDTIQNSTGNILSHIYRTYNVRLCDN